MTVLTAIIPLLFHIRFSESFLAQSFSFVLNINTSVKPEKHNRKVDALQECNSNIGQYSSGVLHHNHKISISAISTTEQVFNSARKRQSFASTAEQGTAFSKWG